MQIKVLLYFTVLFSATLNVIIFQYYSSSRCDKPDPIAAIPIRCLNKSRDTVTINQTISLTLNKIKKHLAIANRYARSGKTMVEINMAYSLIQETLAEKLTTHPIESRGRESSGEPVDSCPEIHKDGKFVTVPCKRTPFEAIVSFAFVLPDCGTMKRVLNGLSQIYKQTSVMLAVENHTESCNHEVAVHSHNFKSIYFHPTSLSNQGSTWRQLISRANTKYVFIGRDLSTFTDQSDIDRLIRMLDTTGVKAAAGSRRNEDGKWSTGCYQMSMKNYTLRLLEGYDISHKSCLYCDYVAASFISMRDVLLEKLSSNLSDSALFIDYFLQLFLPDSIGAITCPDVMFSTQPNDLNHQSKQMWQAVAHKWQLNRIILPNGRDQWFECHEVAIKCAIFTEKPGGEVVPPCCLKILSLNMARLVQFFANNSMHIETCQGTLLGAVKIFGALPWEIDGDFKVYRSRTHQVKQLLEAVSRKFQLKLSEFTQEKQLLYFTSWFIEVYYSLPDLPQRREFTQPTQVLLNGVWINAPLNPGMNLREKLGDDIFQHIEHWRQLLNNKYDPNYSKNTRGKFLPCRKQFHGCLQNNYLPEGNIQFMDIWI